MVGMYIIIPIVTFIIGGLLAWLGGLGKTGITA